ncbi:ribosomal protein S6 kinase delta-1 [Nylanderia fulva]|uniref:ribosomal protein S6 kinase delta-1 n=1 Tax=Nylanderia fulva TaxID=613905 RepID=UPI0010FB726D|nr:ribosomal protein S6 kinase delta-1 [Nylanderia fulva]
MAPVKDKWIRRFIITETRRHKKGFTIYKVTSMVFLKSSHEELSKVSVWKRYNDFKKLHLELSNLHKRLGIKEAFPTLPKSKYFGRFEAEVVEERKKYALKFLEFVGRYSYLYSSDTFITFFETSHADNYASYCAHSLCSDTSEDDLIAPLNDSAFANDTAAQNNTLQVKISHNVSTNPRCALPNIYTNENESRNTTNNLQIANVKKEEQSYKTEKSQSSIARNCNADIRNKNFGENNRAALSNASEFDNVNNNKDLLNCNTSSVISQERANTSYQTQADFTQYLLVAAAHMSAAFKHESITEYEEAFTQYKLGISCLINGVQFDPDTARVSSIKDKISKYLARAEQLYNRHLNCNISVVSKPISELQYYKVLKVMKSVMLVMDIRANCNRIIKTIERSSVHEDNISNYVLRGQIPCMVHLYGCVETETTVFLILQYASCGKLWDFIRLHYEASDHLYTDIISNRVCTNEINQNLDSNENNDELNKTEEVVENNKRRKDHQYPVQNAIYMEVPTIQLLENSQKLLQSVNATLRKSNSIANRLNESKELKHSKDTLSTNIKTRVYQEADCTLSDIYCNKSPNSIKNNDIAIKNGFAEDKDSKGTNSLSINNICESVSNKDDCTIRNLFENKVNDSFYNSTSKTVNAIYICKNNNIKDTIDRINSSNVNCSIDEMQYSHSYKENTLDEEKILWQIPEAVIRSWAAEILSALETLHQQNVLILDFKPDNILLDDAGHVRLTYIIPQRNMELSKLTYPYSSPESIMYSPTNLVTSATDVWSFGIILYELLTGITFIIKHPGLFHSHSTVNIPNNLSENARSLLCGILKYHPDERLTVDEIKHHPFFAETDWSNIVNSQM